MDRVWTNLLAMDMVIDETWDSSGVIIGEWDSDDFEILTRVTGVAKVEKLPPKEVKFTESSTLSNRMKKNPKRKKDEHA